MRQLSHPARSALWQKPRPADGRDLPATGDPALRRPLRHEQREKSGLCFFKRKLRQYFVSRETSSSSSPTRPTPQSRQKLRNVRSEAGHALTPHGHFEGINNCILRLVRPLGTVRLLHIYYTKYILGCNRGPDAYMGGFGGAREDQS